VQHAQGCNSTNMASDHLTVNGQSRPGTVRHPTAPSMMMNSHFAGVGEDVPKEAYEHGIQVVDEDKVFKYVATVHRKLHRRCECC
jgi:hypothetical protein